MNGGKAPAVPAVGLRPSGSMPMVGFGTWRMKGDTARTSVSTALGLGYRHIDTATTYGNHREVGRALSDSGIARDEVFVTTKLTPASGKKARQALEKSLTELGLDQVDLWLLHYPPRQDPLPHVWASMLALREEGLARAVGVSNYSLDLIDTLTAATGEAPAVNQVPCSPAKHDPALAAGLAERGVAMQGYSPLRHTDLTAPELTGPAERLGATPAQVTLAWQLAHRITVLPSSAQPAHIRDNLAAAALELTGVEVARIDEVARTGSAARPAAGGRGRARTT
ncbi:aldo/keto reductase [Streptomyces sp. NPDC048442]|uniref:aldo/keto reductase n=1 Tax=Streptomyces sp. NPDC048442 TaxID=3154823 RepID=UPI003426EA21